MRKERIIRIELKDAGIRSLADQEPDAPGGKPAPPPVPDIRLALKAGELEGWHSQRYGHPVSRLSFLSAEEDMPVVRRWLEGGGETSRLPGATLTRNFSEAVHSALTGFGDAALRANMLTAPLRVGLCLRTVAGRRLTPQQLTLPVPNATAPDLVLRSYTIYENGAAATVEIMGDAMRLMASAAKIENPAIYSDIAAVDIIATRQAETFDENGTASGFETETVGPDTLRVARYARYTAAEVRASASALDDFRVVASIPMKELMDGMGWTPVPIPEGALSNWKNLPKHSDSAPPAEGAIDPEGDGSDTEGDNEEPEERTEEFETAPLSLGMPEEEKRVRGVTLRGLFERDATVIELWGSHHRENWHRIAAARGPHIAGLCGVRYRWLKVRIRTTLRKGDFLEALTFTIA